MTTRPLLPALLVCLWLAAAGPAAAHDTWFTTRGPWWTGNLLLRLGTGERFPSHDTGVGAEHLVQRGCRAAGREVSLEPWFGLANALVLHSQVQRGAPVSCWARLSPFEIELEPEVVARYFEEVRPPQAVRDAWAAQRARGVPWRERYVKHARIELFADDAAPAAPPHAELPLDLVVESRPPVPRAGDTLVVRALRDGQPLPEFAVELVGSGAGTARWLRTDAQGRVVLQPTRAGRWLLRGVDLRPAPDRAGWWDSRFISLTFEIAAAAPGAGTPSR